MILAIFLAPSALQKHSTVSDEVGIYCLHVFWRLFYLQSKSDA